ncbi:MULTISPECIES: AraC family transcriptional regulator [Streptomyces]|uniref:AraC family transcriptional regulator n=1 Tax=Streptomyces caniscabiei TaxID=2746961 RepID=A0ABU4MSL0_9ACTN|nr:MULTISPECIES: AraC family transcriptional regulator [Streptomyces]MBE4738131.1 AraC family transcriptional regulator [Streptomyces caniscabiei]MBE4756894.1 AraC family transcriptional regulator [Streptomyces caniscabiei]MBE4773834.1 AraC family transcriptional regulator [Streptomyces caniscabiei]MBE4785596.1 AraC family transcriptional regulator [Streptomyces caniscabiei]MBE4796939.1 AraC family transcriptional regulator [Streptomyces caniscabiei]
MGSQRSGSPQQSGSAQRSGSPRRDVTAWRPRVSGVVEVFHAHYTEYAYPMHVHDVWTLLIVDDGAVRYELDRHEHGTPHDTVSLLPPFVPHNGAPVTERGFRKRVLYLDPNAPLAALDASLVGAAVDGPDLRDPVLRRRVGQLHAALARPGDELEAESRLALVGERLRWHLRPSAAPESTTSGAGAGAAPGARSVAHRLRELLDERVADGITLEEAAGTVQAHPAHLVRAFGAAFGIAPHQYLMSRRVERARRLLLEGMRPGEAAAEAGFYDQAHLTRHFGRWVGVTPGRYRNGRPPRPASDG